MLSVIPFDTIDPSRDVIATPRAVSTWKELADRADDLTDRLGKLHKCRVGLRIDANLNGLAAVMALERQACEVFLLASDLTDAESVERARQFGIAALIDLSPSTEIELTVQTFERAEPGSGQAGIVILTSGTSGKPKAARHTWRSLARPVRITDEHPAPRWLLAYRPNLYAGLQVILQCLVNGGTLIVPDAGADADAVATLAADTRAEFASATPSYWRWLLTFAKPQTLGRMNLLQITLGGEAIEQPVLNALATQFPSTRIVHIYATTELGRCFSVTDKRAGFPAAFLEGASADGVELRIDDGELWVRSPNAMAGYDARSDLKGDTSTFFATGDLVEVRGDRVHFVGRRTDIINVGGNKVNPLEVERVVQAVPGVVDARVFPQASSIVGQLVACDILPEPSLDHDALIETVRAHCNATLASYQRPRIINVVDQMSVSTAFKKIRRNAP